jgi:Fis family transcriptional regulator
VTVKATRKDVRTVLDADVTGTREPLRECVRDAVNRYFSTLDGHECCGLFDLVMNEVEAPLLEAVLEHTGGNQTRAARLLGMNRGTLRKKLKQYDLE